MTLRKQRTQVLPSLDGLEDRVVLTVPIYAPMPPSCPPKPPACPPCDKDPGHDKDKDHGHDKDKGHGHDKDKGHGHDKDKPRYDVRPTPPKPGR